MSVMTRLFDKYFSPPNTTLPTLGMTSQIMIPEIPESMKKTRVKTLINALNLTRRILDVTSSLDHSSIQVLWKVKKILLETKSQV
jgi:hypothetical protein